MKLEKALTLYLGNLGQPVITIYDFGLVLLRFYTEKKFHGESISVQKDMPGMPEVHRYLEKLKDNGILDQVKGFPEDKVFSIIGKSDVSAKEIVCGVDPFAYVSHLSAMEYHGVTDRMPKILFVSTLPQLLWNIKAKEKMAKEYGRFADGLDQVVELPSLRKLKPEKIKGVVVNWYQSKNIGSYVAATESNVRVASIGRTFLDMVREPSLCGGIRHVIDVYKNNARGLKRLIVDEINRHGTAIEKARAGYILEEECHLKDAIIDAWAMHVTRGGSRKMDPNEPFSSEFSERWCISINC